MLAGRSFIDELPADLLAREPNALSFFPYPNTPTKLRPMAVIDVRDLLILRVAAGRIASATDPILSPRVHSYRLSKKPPGWCFRSPKKSHDRFRRAAAKELLEDGLGAMCRTDVKTYYPSVRLDLLQACLMNWECNPEAIAVIVGLLSHWQARDGLSGLPIGPGSSAVLGNAFLKSIDDRLEALESPHHRYMDDFLLLGRDLPTCRAALEPLDHELTELQLLRSTDKTIDFATPEEALAEIEDHLLASMAAASHDDRLGTLELVRAAFEEEIRGRPDAARGRFRWIVRFMTNERDPFAAATLASDIDVMNIDPAVASEYLRVVGLTSAPTVDSVMTRLVSEPSDRTEGLDLHLLRAMTSASWGRPEGNAFLKIAADHTRRPPIRCWAWQAVKQTPVWQRGDVIERLHEESNRSVQRAMVVTFRREDPDRNRAPALNHVRERFRSLRHTVRWVEAA